jgi:hypothetical protein
LIRFTVIVSGRDAAETLPRTLAALADQEGAPSHELVVADDSSDAARNAAVAGSSGSLLAFCDAGCRPSPDWLAAGARALADADLVQGRVLPEPAAGAAPSGRVLPEPAAAAPAGPARDRDASPHGPTPFVRDISVTSETGLYDAANMFVTRALFDRLGGFQPAPAGSLGPGAWLAWRARRDGARTSFSADARAHRRAVSLEPLEYVEEATRLRDLPAAVAAVPELRDTLLHRRLFASRRSMKLKLALAGLALAARRRSALPLIAAAPYALELRGTARERGGEDWKRVAAIDAAADLMGALALLHGSVESRTPVL